MPVHSATVDFEPVIRELQEIADKIYPDGVLVQQGRETCLERGEPKHLITISGLDLRGGVEALGYQVRCLSHHAFRIYDNKSWGVTNEEVEKLLENDGIQVDDLVDIEALQAALDKRFGPGLITAKQKARGFEAVSGAGEILTGDQEFETPQGRLFIGRCILSVEFNPDQGTMTSLQSIRVEE